MNKMFRMLCLGLAAAVFTTSFAQEGQNVTDKLVNADMEKGVVGWDLTFESNVWKKQSKSSAGYHGVDGFCVENWQSSTATGLTDNSISQSLTGLPNGTYVFGAYLVAALGGDAVENRDAVTGVTIFANEVEVPVATNWPEHEGMKWSHSAKFNVAAYVEDGTLKVGVKTQATNANFLLMDNATLYYFGEMEAADALNEMAKIDIAASVAVADTLANHKMSVDTLQLLTESSEVAKELAGADEAYQVSEDLWWSIGIARKSIADYSSFSETIAEAKAVAEKEWSAEVESALQYLNELIGQAEAIYEEAFADRLTLQALQAEMVEAVAYVKLDSVYLRWAELDEEVVPNLPVGEELGQYTEDMVIRILELLEEVLAALSNEENTAVEAQELCDNLFAQIQEILDNPISFDEFPIIIPRGTESVNGQKVLKGSFMDDLNLVTYKSKTYSFQYPLSKIRFIIKENGSNSLENGYPYVALSSFEMYDGEGNEIELTKEMLYSNADHVVINPGDYPKEGLGVEGLIDNNSGTFFHSAWKNGPADYHYIEVTLPEGQYDAFSFMMAARSNLSRHAGQFPAVMEITYISDAITRLQNVTATAREMHPVQGTTPGFVNYDPAAFYVALEAAEALLVAEKPLEGDINAALTTLQAEVDKAYANVIMPEPGKKYRIVNAGDFMGQQGVHKAMTIRNDSTHYYQLWWETAAADSASQLFSFEVMENEDGKYYYSVKHEATGRYMSDYIDAEGYYEVNAFSVLEQKDTVELYPLGYGQFGFLCGEPTGKTNSSQMHALSHSSGAGTTAGVSKWKSGPNDWSAWYIREMSALPCATKSISDLKFETAPIHLYESTNCLSIKADKDCAFTDFVLYDLYGKVVPTMVSKNDTATTIVIDTTAISSFSFAFTNAEGVSEVNILSCGLSKLSELKTAYEEALAKSFVQGDEVGQVSDLTEYNEALAVAEALLANGGSDEEFLNAVALLDSALAHTKVNWPEGGKEYFVLFNYPKFKETHGIEMGMYAEEESLLWSYVQPYEQKYLWRFVQHGTQDSDPIYYIQNTVSGLYIGSIAKLSTALTLVEEGSADLMTYRIFIEGEENVLRATKWTNTFLHPNKHSSGAGAYGTVIYWKESFGTPSVVRVVEKERYLNELTDNIEDIEVVDEYIAPAKKGIYDLYGRRIMTPTATGIYIVDGKKVLVKREQK